MPEIGDAFGQMLWDHHAGNSSIEIVERDDGLVEVTGGPNVYFSEYRSWPSEERSAMRHVRGRVLDVGCGAGRVCLHLQSKGHEVVGIDVSPLALKVCRQRGVRKVVRVAFHQINNSLGMFDTVVMFGNNFGLFAGESRAKTLLKRLHRMTSDRGRIIAETRDVYKTKDPVHLAYHRRNRARARMGGQVRIRSRYRNLSSGWFDYLMVSREELRSLLRGTGWLVTKYIEPSDQSDMYIAIIDKE